MRSKSVTFAALIFALLAGIPAGAQLAMGLKLNRDTYMCYEPVYSCITLRNDTGRALVFGDDPRIQGKLILDIRDERDRAIPLRSGVKAPSISSLVLRPGETRPVMVLINNFYNIEKPGLYRVRARVSHPMMKDEFYSQRTLFRVENGYTFWSRTVGLPDLDGNNPGIKSGHKYEERTYSLRSLNDNSTKYIYLVVEDDRKIYGVTRVGRALGHERVTAEVDMLSRVHLLIPISPRVFHYLSFGLDGSNTVNQYWKIGESIPTLIRNPKNGLVSLVGGDPAKSGIDYVNENTSKVTAGRLFDQYEERYNETHPQHKGSQSGGTVDLGKGL